MEPKTPAQEPAPEPAAAAGDLEPLWYLVGNIVEQRTFGPDGAESASGTKIFSGGTKVYCLPGRWAGNAYFDVEVIGRNRGAKKLVKATVRRTAITNWRVQVVHSPSVLRRIRSEPNAEWIKSRAQEQAGLFSQDDETDSDTDPLP